MSNASIADVKIGTPVTACRDCGWRECNCDSDTYIGLHRAHGAPADFRVSDYAPRHAA